PGSFGQRAASRQPAGLDLGPGGRQVVPARDLHVDALLQGQQGPEEVRRAPAAGRVLSDGRPEDEPADGLHPPSGERRGRRAEVGLDHAVSGLELELPERSGSVSAPPTRWDELTDRAFRGLSHAATWLILVLLAFILWSIGRKAGVAMRDFGFGFLTSTTWDVAKQQFGVLPQICGTLYSSLLALMIGGFFGVVMAIFLTQDFLPPRLAQVFRTTVELLAAIPSVVYGLWGLFVVVPAMRPTANWLYEHVGWIPFFGSALSGPGLAPAAMVLAIMVLPTVAAVSQD